MIPAAYQVYEVHPSNPNDKMNGDGRFGRDVCYITHDQLNGHHGFSKATKWCEENLEKPGTYIIMALCALALPKFKLIVLEATEPRLRVVRPT